MIRRRAPAGIVNFVPAGISLATTSRVVVVSFCAHMSGPSALGLRPFGQLGRDRAIFSGERGLQRVPRQRRALDAHGKLAHAGEHRELAELGRARLPRRRAAVTRSWKRSKSASASARVLPFSALGHHRGRGRRDRAARALEADVLRARRRRAARTRSPGRRRAGCSPRRCRFAPASSRKFRGRLLWSRITSW